MRAVYNMRQAPSHRARPRAVRAWLSTLPGSLRLLLFGCVTFACAREATSVFVNQPVSPAPAPPVAASAAPAPPAPNPPKSPASRSDALAERYGAAPPLAVFKVKPATTAISSAAERRRAASSTTLAHSLPRTESYRSARWCACARGAAGSGVRADHRSRPVPPRPRARPVSARRPSSCR